MKPLNKFNYELFEGNEIELLLTKLRSSSAKRCKKLTKLRSQQSFAEKNGSQNI